MRKLLLLSVFTVMLHASWGTAPQLDYIELSSSYEKAKIAQENNRKMCRKHIAKAQLFRDTMRDTERDRQIMAHKLFLVKRFCSEVAGCNCRR